MRPIYLHRIIIVAIITTGRSVIGIQLRQPNTVQNLEDFIGLFTNFLNEGSHTLVRSRYQSNGLVDDGNVRTTVPYYRTLEYPIEDNNFVMVDYLQTNHHDDNDSTFVTALSSIARHDDLRCVPRILCEVTAGTLPENSSSPAYQRPHQQISTLPFISKDALIRLLTSLNFVDNSPMLLFARAALLGYTSRGDAKSCLAAYSTCPKDQDRLIDYLNNYNGGFFKFFNVVPDHPTTNPIRLDRKQTISKRILNSQLDIVPESAIPIFPSTDRFLSSSPSSSGTNDLENFQPRENKRIVFPVNEGTTTTNDGYDEKRFPAFVLGVRGGKSIRNGGKVRKIVFPKEIEQTTNVDGYAVAEEPNYNGNELFVPDDRKIVPSKVTFSNLEFGPQFVQRLTRYPQPVPVFRFKDY